MFYIYFKLDNQKQLEGLYPERMRDIIRQTETLLSEAGGSRLEGDGEIYQFAALYRETAITVLDSAVRLKACLDERHEYLYGYSVILSSGHDDEDLNVRFHNLSLLTEQENLIWLEAASLEDFEAFLESPAAPEGEELIPVTVRQEKMQFVEDRFRTFLHREDVIPGIHKDMNEWLYRENEASGLVMRAGDTDEALRILREVLEDSNNLIDSFLTFEPAPDFWDPVLPLVRFVNRDFLSHVSRYLSPEDQMRWKNAGAFLESVCRSDWYLSSCDQFTNDFMSAFALYWSGCLRKLDTYPTPPVMIIREPEAFSPASLDLILQMLRRVQKEYPRQKYLFITKSEELPAALAEETLRSLSIAPARGDLAVRKTAEAFPESTVSGDEIIRMYKAQGRRLHSLFFSFWNVREDTYDQRPLPPDHLYMIRQDRTSCEILYLILLSRHCVVRSQIVEFFTSREIPHPEVEERLKRLEHLGFLRFFPRSCGADGPAAILELLADRCRETAGELMQAYSDYLRTKCAAGEIRSLSGLFHFLERAGDIDFALEILNRIINHLLNIRQTDLAESLLDSELFKGRPLSNPRLEGLHNIQYAGRLRCALIRRDDRDLARKMEGGYLSLMEAQGDYCEEFLLQQAHYHALQGDSDTALAAVKKSLFAFQKSSNHTGETRANIALALTLLSQRKVQASIDYFEIALRISEQIKDRENSLVCGKLNVLASYLFGNLSMALRSLDSYLPQVEQERNRETQLFLLFLKGRILFELGRYPESFKVLKNARRLSRLYGLASETRVITAWAARALCFGHSPKAALDLLAKQNGSLETAYFTAEAHCLNHDAPAGARVLEEALEKYDQNPEYIHEMDSWADGYRLVEGRLSDSSHYEDVLLDQSRGLYYYLIGKTGRIDEALAGLKPLCLMDRAYNQQPFGYYFFFYAQELMQSREEGEDENPMLLLSHAFKLLQTRAGRFDSQQMKHSFFRKNYWNNEIVKKAQELNFF